MFLPLLAGAQSLEGTWFLAGEYFEVNGGLTVTKNGDLETGTITFERTGGDNYRVTVNTTDVEVDANEDWDASLTDTFAELGAFPLTAGSKDSALQVDLSGLASVWVNGPESGTALVEVYDIGDSNDNRLVNVSAQNQVGTGFDILIAGFVVTGDDPKNVLIRGVGPGLGKYIGNGFLRDPLLKVFNSGGDQIASNDNWDASLRPSFVTTGAFDLDDFSLDAALILTLPPGSYTAQLSGADGGTGRGLVEIYELP